MAARRSVAPPGLLDFLKEPLPMPSRDPRCVFVAYDFSQADVVAGWLCTHGIQAQVMNGEMQSGFSSLLVQNGATAVEVWVADAAQVPEALRLLGDQALTQLGRQANGPPLEVVCEECGEASTFPSEQRGTVQECPHCYAYLDVEDPEAAEEQEDPEDPEGTEQAHPRSDGITDDKGWGLMEPRTGDGGALSPPEPD
jgi:hypothetical protein